MDAIRVQQTVPCYSVQCAQLLGEVSASSHQHLNETSIQGSAAPIGEHLRERAVGYIGTKTTSTDRAGVSPAPPPGARSEWLHDEGRSQKVSHPPSAKPRDIRSVIRTSSALRERVRRI